MTYVACLAAGVCLATTATAQAIAAAQHSAPYTVPRTEVFTLAAPNAGYRLSVGLPLGYEETTERYPVVYVLDGDWYFAIALSTARLLNAVGELPPLIVVSIGYGGTIADQRSRRIRDFTPRTERSLEGSGHADAFLRDLQTSIIPRIESSYRTTTDRTLVGHSLGGLFATYAMSRVPAIFARVIIGSPALWSSAPWLFKELSALTGTGALPRRIFLGVAGGDFAAVRESYDAWHGWLKSTPRAGVDWRAADFADMTHQSVVMSLIAQGLPWAFAAK